MKEFIYWTIVAFFGVAAWWWREYRAAPLNADFERGKADGVDFLKAGVTVASILAFIEAQKKIGKHGAYESGLRKAVDEEAVQ